eukprot:GDKI01021094.1.p1 GENE.GDKI01021094.1~~GDKI01021094.1.p1  ORF type:complete len:263 (+),score=66.10 GDKI01021094.1:117-905(+)
MRLLFLFGTVCALLAHTAVNVEGKYEWTKADEEWLQGVVPSKDTIEKKHGVSLLPSGITGVWDTYLFDAEVQDLVLQKLGIPWWKRTVAKWFKPVFNQFPEKLVSPTDVNAKNGNVSPRIHNDSDLVPVVEMRTEVMTYFSRTMYVRVDGKEYGSHDDQLGVEWSVRATKLEDGRVMIARHNEQMGIVREMHVALSADPKGALSTPVQLFATQMEPSDGSGVIESEIWLSKKDTELKSSSVRGVHDKQTHSGFSGHVHAVFQ